MNYREMKSDEISRIGEVNRAESVAAEFVTRCDGTGFGLVTERMVRPEPLDIPPWGDRGAEIRAGKWKPALERGGHLYGAFEEERLVGFIILGPVRSDRSAEIVALFVDRDHRRRGIAGALMAWAERKAREGGVDALFLYSNPTESSVGFYRSRGFGIVGLISKEVVPSLPEDIVMAKRLDAWVKLSEVVDAFDSASWCEDGVAYVNRRTGETWWCDMAGDEILTGEEPAEVEEYAESPDWIDLPHKHDFDEYRLMERFCAAREDPVRRDRLLRAIRGRGAFGRFRVLAEEYGLLDEWHRVRDEALERMLVEWLEAEGIAFTRE